MKSKQGRARRSARAADKTNGAGYKSVDVSSSGAGLIVAERLRQITEENWTPDHDARHKRFQMTLAAISYAAVVARPDEWAKWRGELPGPEHDWPWAKKWWKPSDDPIRNLTKAGALIAAEIDRLMALNSQPSTKARS